ncbi:hypothetical protein BDZ94DRAFT_1308127 [Collybia nuda]|uniref:Uncharacterized protein n=1 Tax=Collybia nuda TaxID=64659 RepID=A0A9P5Y7G8_9AGAR|nr:hypothetical protein BDZ94DRAFT_1308127 [Collybia nuda]
MPLSKENPHRAQVQGHDSVVNPETHQAKTMLLPSEVARPTRSDTAPQQASTQPGDGHEIHTGKHAGKQPEGVNVVEVPAQTTEKVPFKEQVIGVAKKTRGTLLGKPELKQHGEMILEGKALAHDEPLSMEEGSRRQALP